MIVGIIQARMGASRFYGKVYEKVAGYPLLELVIRRCQRARMMDKLVLATTVEPEDDCLCDMATALGIQWFRNSKADVLKRFYQCGLALGMQDGDIVVRITADDPLKDPDLIDDVVKELICFTTLDYCSNTIEPTYPLGLDIEAMRFRALRKAYEEAILIEHREHVTMYIYSNGRFRCKNLKMKRPAKIDLSGWRWTIDTPHDLREINKLLCRHGVDPVTVRYDELISKEMAYETTNRERTKVS